MRLMWRVIITMFVSEFGLLATLFKDSIVPGIVVGVFVYVLWKPLFDKEREHEQK